MMHLENLRKIEALSFSHFPFFSFLPIDVMFFFFLFVLFLCRVEAQILIFGFLFRP